MQYAADKKVGVLLWYNSGGPHNRVTEMPRGMMDMPSVRRFEFERLKKWGVKGVKVDFFQSDKQKSMALYQDILADAADFQIMVNFHGCTMPRGWSRTWPNLGHDGRGSRRGKLHLRADLSRKGPVVQHDPRLYAQCHRPDGLYARRFFQQPLSAQDQLCP